MSLVFWLGKIEWRQGLPGSFFLIRRKARAGSVKNLIAALSEIRRIAYIGVAGYVLGGVWPFQSLVKVMGLKLFNCRGVFAFARACL